MSEADTVGSKVTIRAENIGGIAETEIGIPPGVTVLEGKNATNRTSFLQAVMAALGSDNVSVKGDAEKGEVELILGGDTYTRTLRRTDSGVATSGDPYLDEPMVADLFAFLLESNEARRAVAQEADLRDIIMRPVDTDEINAEIDRLEAERNSVDEQLEELENLKEELPSLEERRTDLESRIADKREELAKTEAEIKKLDAGVDESRAEKQELETRLGELRDLRSELEDVRSEIELQQQSISSLRGERSELTDELSSLPEPSTGDNQHLEQRITELRERKQSLEGEMSNLQDVIQFNVNMLDGEVDPVTDALGTIESSDGGLTDQLVDDESVVCWTCGSEVEQERITETVDQLRTVRQDYLTDIREIEDKLDELRSKKHERESQQRHRQKLERKLENIGDELDNRESSLAELRKKRERLNEDIEPVENEVEKLESEDFSDVLVLHKEANQLEFELEQLESDIDNVSDQIARIEDQLAEEGGLRSEREELTECLREQRTRIDRIEANAVDAFNEHMEAVLELLEYDNIARIWIERVQKTVCEGRRKVNKTAFELHVVRTSDSGVAYEDTIDHLSESEREVAGLVFALAGYLVHSVHEDVPFMMLDSLEAIDADRLADLVEYFSDHAAYLVIALLPEDAQVISAVDTHITEI